MSIRPYMENRKLFAYFSYACDRSDSTILFFSDQIRWMREHRHTQKKLTHTHVKMPNGCVMESLHYHLQCNILVSFPHHKRPIDEKFFFHLRYDVTNALFQSSAYSCRRSIPFNLIWFPHTFVRRWSWGIVRDIWYCNLHVGSHRCFIAPSHVPFQWILSHSFSLSLCRNHGSDGGGRLFVQDAWMAFRSSRWI